ncbi:hypothetical protein [Vibrio astriarenae]|uniref:hypothetical protein n=1 Tax=Vibrio astriarenae TaxID=1481923 RepID=UPI0037365F62
MPIDVTELNEWVKTDEGAEWIGNQTSDLRSQLGNAKGELGELGTKLETLEKTNTDLENLKTKLESDVEEAKLAGAKPDEEMLAQKNALKNKLDVAEKQVERLQKGILNERLSTLISNEITKQGGNPRVLGVHVRTRMAAELDEDGRVEAWAVDNKGKKLYDDDAKVAGVEYVVNQLKKDKEFMNNFKAPVKSGTGTTDADDPKPQSKNTKSFMDMDLKELGDTKNLGNLLFT